MEKKRSKLEKRIEQSYMNATEIVSLLQKYDFEIFITNTIDQLDSIFSDKKLNQLPILSAIILTKVNEILSKIQNKKDKTNLKYILSDLFESYFRGLNDNSIPTNILEEVIKELRTTCQLAGYEYNELERLLNLEKHIALRPISPSKQNRNLYYDWHGKDYELDELSRDLYDKRIILSVKEFKKIFKQIEEPFSFRCNSEKKSELLLIFQILKMECLITPKGLSGHFAPLVKYAVDNDGIFLFKKAPNKIHELMKRNKAKYYELKGKYTNMIEQTVCETLGQLRVNGHYPPKKQII